MKFDIVIKNQETGEEVLTLKEGKYVEIDFNKPMHRDDAKDMLNFLLNVTGGIVGSLFARFVNNDDMDLKVAKRLLENIAKKLRVDTFSTFVKALSHYKKENSKVDRTEGGRFTGEEQLSIKEGIIGDIQLFFTIVWSFISNLHKIIPAILSGHKVELNVVRIENDDKELQQAVKEGPGAVRRLLDKRREIEELQNKGE